MTDENVVLMGQLMVSTALQIPSAGLWLLAVEFAVYGAIPLLVICYVYLQFQKMIRKTIREEFQKLKEEQGK